MVTVAPKSINKQVGNREKVDTNNCGRHIIIYRQKTEQDTEYKGIFNEGTRNTWRRQRRNRWVWAGPEQRQEELNRKTQRATDITKLEDRNQK